MTRSTQLERVLFAGGGTGGHLYMAIAIAGELKNRYPSIGFLFTGTAGGIESRILPPLGFELRTIRIGGLKNVGIKRLLRTLFQMPLSLISSLRIARDFDPSIVVGVGGYSSGPVVAACRLLTVPSMILEPNVHPGFANRLLGRFVQGAAVAYDETARWFGTRARLTGIPIRAEFFSTLPFSGPSTPLKILVFGGSQGSRPINRLLLEALPHLTPEKVDILHQTGPANYEEVLEDYRKLGYEAHITPYIDDMPARFQWADLIISRAGASTIAEITAAGRPSVLIPFPQAADDHQKRNAVALADRGAAVMLEQGDTRGENLAAQIQQMLAHPERLREMARAAHSLAKPEATRQIADFIEELAQ